ncbi:hypothetical protein MOC99_18920 [Bacillus haynesii]|uniref:hypothetical protein n=1 Tax=Bacillus haynesii TaxID=1925021 RepID=UPI002281DB6B|nr:hypothetical protein [Bacillus haynesii]MCY8351877.1 hypothetical protein [Bacillus haynesii]
MENKTNNEIVVDVSEKLNKILSEFNKDSPFFGASEVITIISLIVSGVAVYLTYKISNKDRYTEIVSRERLDWIEKLRETFHEFNELVDLYALELDRVRGYVNPTSEELKQLYMLRTKIEQNWSITFLYINPTEILSKKLKELKDDLYEKLLLNKSKELNVNFDIKVINNIKPEIIYIQSVILKSEWKRVKIEVEKGQDLSKGEMKDICIELAKNQDEKLFEKLFKD